jgi:hypothetical protein
LGYHRNIPPDWKDNLRVVLVATRNPLNIGAAARAMANFGFASLRVVEPYGVAFREARSAVGAAPLLRSAEEFPRWPKPWRIALRTIWPCRACRHRHGS